jgi:threonylcarbamoyladenosine tRNA methylthiotransferase MtaB
MSKSPPKKNSVLVRSLGCRVNLADAADAVDRLSSGSFRVADDLAEADVALLHTCTVTHKADRDVRKILGAWMRDRPDLPVVVSGCAVVTMGEVLREYQNVSKLVAPGDPQAVAAAVADLGGTTRDPGQHASPFRLLNRKRAIVKVQDGCNARCAYCVIPIVRGPERSWPVEAVVAKVNRMLRLGHHEVVLSGIHLGRYRTENGTDLAGLLRTLSPVLESRGADYRLRLSSIEPMELTGELLEEISAARFVCRHFHVPLQSGDDEVLGRMGRPYRADEFADVIRSLRERFEDAALGTDVLVGFPGESEAAAENTLRLVESLPLSYLHVFTFSPRPGTPAAEMPGQVPQEVMRRRSAALRDVGRRHWRQFQESGLGRHHQVLLEKKQRNAWLGRTREYRRFHLEYQSDIEEEVVEARAESLDGDTLVGVVSSQVKP